MIEKLTRRKFLVGGAAMAAAAVSVPSLFLKKKTLPPGSVIGLASQLGHRMRDGTFPSPQFSEKVETVIIGGGISGLSGARVLQKAGVDFRLLELESALGGNSHSGSRGDLRYPWGAHYVPLVGPEAYEVCDFFKEIGIIEGFDSRGLARYREDYLCADPQERLYLHGKWQEGLVPGFGVDEGSRRQMGDFFSEMEKLKIARGRDGKPLFAIPVARSSQDPKWIALDKLNFADYLKSRGWDSPYLLWYTDYCCRDDYGAGIQQVSAWAGLHYFASRSGHAANAESSAVLTWPEGNGFLVNKLKTPETVTRSQSRTVVFRVKPQGSGWQVDYWSEAEQVSKRLLTRTVVWAAPRFVASHVVEGLTRTQLSYAPWMVANVVVSQEPKTRSGAPLAWDNVSYSSRSLGYIHSRHQESALDTTRTALTYYLPLDDQPPAQARAQALTRSYANWATSIVTDLETMHPEIRPSIENIDVWVWGHAMRIPTPGSVFQKSAPLDLPGLVFVHSDQSPISIFEEAFTNGVTGAQATIRTLNRGRV